MAISGRITGLGSSAQGKAVVKETLEKAPEAERAGLRSLFEAVATADGNRHLTGAEASIVHDAYSAASAGGGVVDLTSVRKTVLDQIADRLASSDPDGIRSYFTSTTSKMGDVLVQSMKDVIAEAKGKPVEFNAMVFSFTDKDVGDAVLALAKEHPNVTFRFLVDFAQLTTSGGRQAPRLEADAKKQGLDNIHVKYKRDSAYVWSSKLRRPVYNHTATKGLNHHKGFVALIDGRPVKLVTGSYNWSDTAESSNYENLFVVDGGKAVNRAMVTGYQAEFVGFFNHADALNTAQAKAWKRQVYNQLRAANGEAPYGPPASAAPDPPYVPRAPAASFDVNEMSDANYDKIRALDPSERIPRSIVSSFATYGAYSSFEDLLERVPKLAALSEAELEKWRSALDFGDGKVSLNSASANELARALKIPKSVALAIVAKRQDVGDFESVDELRGLSGISDAVFTRIAPRLSASIGRAFFSARGHDDPAASTGYAPENRDATVPVMGQDGVVKQEKATLTAGVVDLMNRAQPGQEVLLGMYGLSVSTPEYAAIAKAAARGVKFKIVLNDAYNEGAAAALKGLAAAGLAVEARIQTARTMHEKFGVVGDDVFQGSANFSASSSLKHSEDRFVVKNNPELAADYKAEFDGIWQKSAPV